MAHQEEYTVDIIDGPGAYDLATNLFPPKASTLHIDQPPSVFTIQFGTEEAKMHLLIVGAQLLDYESKLYQLNGLSPWFYSWPQAEKPDKEEASVLISNYSAKKRTGSMTLPPYFCHVLEGGQRTIGIPLGR